VKLAGQTQSLIKLRNYLFDAFSVDRDPCSVPIAAILAKNSG